MELMFHRSLGIPLWAVAFGAVALMWMPNPVPSVMAMIVIAVAASMMTVIVRRLSPRRLRFESAAGTHDVEQIIQYDGSVHVQQDEVSVDNSVLETIRERGQDGQHIYRYGRS
jgi:hypothetical protein